MISVCFLGKPLQIYAPITNAEEDEVEQFYKDLQDFLERTAKKKKKKKDVLSIIEDQNAKARSQE